MESILQDFEAAALPHLSAAYNLARWLTRDNTDAEDVVHERAAVATRDCAQYLLHLDAAESRT